MAKFGKIDLKQNYFRGFMPETRETKIDLRLDRKFKTAIEGWAKAQRRSTTQAILNLLQKVIIDQNIDIISINPETREKLQAIAASRGITLEAVINEYLYELTKSIED
ncbi:MAG: hypothetical protein ACRCYP_01190 [Alphaproteobacteria bacterium]